jgi:hypothetical protein
MGQDLSSTLASVVQLVPHIPKYDAVRLPRRNLLPELCNKSMLRGRISAGCEHNRLDHTDVVFGVLPGGQPVQLVGAFPELVVAPPHRKLQSNKHGDAVRN